MTFKPRTTKLISLFLIISFVLPSVLLLQPKTARAQLFTYSFTDVWTQLTLDVVSAQTVETTTDTFISLSNVAKEIGRQLLMAVARRALQEVTKSTVNWINSGFHGAPLFLENPESFFTDIAKSEVKNMVDFYGYDPHKYPFGKAFALQLINTYKNKLEDNTAYSLNKVMADPVSLQNYQTNFNVGGWNGFIINTQYPQNNPVGFEMEAQKEISFRIRGTGKSPAQKVQETLDQGMGFLAPQTCQTNPNYNTGYNEFNAPRFDSAKWFKDHPYEGINGKGGYASYNEWEVAMQSAKTAFYDPKGKTHCPPGPNGSSGLTTTTPGAVVANQITTSMSSVVRNKELAAAMGNSLSAIFDALIDKFAQEGLTALSSSNNPKPKEDEWSYDNLTLGSPSEGGTHAAWDSGPEEPIILSEFKQTIGEGIANTKLELTLLDNTSSGAPGIMQQLGQLWPKARELDICIPGPDMGWGDRIGQEMVRNSKKLTEKSSEADGEKAAEADLVLKELKFATDFFTDWINNKMMMELPNSIIYMDAVDETQKLSQQSSELTDRRRAKTQALARLQAVQTNLAQISEPPEPGSSQEKQLVLLWKQYKSVRNSVANTTTVEAARNELAIATERLINMKNMVIACEKERTAKGWGNPGGALSTYSGEGIIAQAPSQQKEILPVNSEQAIFCSLPILGGYNHESFKNKTGITHRDIPLVNAENVLIYQQKGGFLGLQTENRKVNIQLSCNSIFKANLLDYKGNFPGFTPISETYEPLPDDTGKEIEPGEEIDEDAVN